MTRIKDAINELKNREQYYPEHAHRTRHTDIPSETWDKIVGVLEAAEPININLNYATAQTRLEKLHHRLEALAASVLGEGE